MATLKNPQGELGSLSFICFALFICSFLLQPAVNYAFPVLVSADKSHRLNLWKLPEIATDGGMSC